MIGCIATCQAPRLKWESATRSQRAPPIWESRPRLQTGVCRFLILPARWGSRSENLVGE